MIIKFHPRTYIYISIILCLMFQGCPEAETMQSTPESTPTVSMNAEMKRTLAPGFTLRDLSGNEVSLKQYKDKVVLLDFWATWCPPCRRSIPELVDLQKKYLDQGLVILGISTDDPRRTGDKSLLAFKEHYKINYRILRADSSVTMDYFGTGSMAIPTLFIIDREGGVVTKIVGFQPGIVEKKVKNIL